MNSVLQANQGQENSGADTDEVIYLQVVKSEENIVWMLLCLKKRAWFIGSFTLLISFEFQFDPCMLSY